MFIPAFSLGNPDIPAEVYEKMKKKYIEEFETDTGYVNLAFNQSSGNEVKSAESDPTLSGVKK